jgi:WD40 repeat protein
VASAHEDKVVRLFDPLSTRPVQELRGHQDSVSCLAQSGQQLAFGTTGGVVGLWDLRRTVKLVEQTAHARKYEEGVGGVAWSGGRLVSGGADGSVRVWQVGSGQK